MLASGAMIEEVAHAGDASLGKPGGMVCDPRRQASIRQLKSNSELTPLSDAWRELCECHGGAIEHLEWVNACLLRGGSAAVLTVFQNDELTAVAALARHHRRGISQLELIGVAEHFEPMDFVARNDESRRRLCEAVAEKKQPVFLERLPADSPTLPLLKVAFGRKSVIRVSPQAAAPWIALDDSWSSPESHLNSGRRSDLRRARKRADELGAVEFQIHCPSPEELPALLDEAFAVEERSWKGKQGTALARDHERGEFFRRYAEAACLQGCLRLCFLRIAGRAVAMQFAVEQSRSFWLLKVGYDESYSRCSPGMLLTRETIAYAANRKLLTYEFLGTCSPWTSVWTDRRREYVRMKAYPFSLAGATALFVDCAASGLHKVRQVVAQTPGAAKNSVKSLVHAVVSKASRRYIAGASLSDAVKVRDRLELHEFQTTLGFWDGEGDAPEMVAARYLEALESMRGKPAHAYL